MFLPESLKIIFGIILLAFWVLSVLARRNPHVPWLQAFNFRSRLTPEQQKRLRRASNRTAALELILLGIMIPFGYIVLKLIFFNAMQPGEIVLVACLSLLCMVAGVVGLRQSHHDG